MASGKPRARLSIVQLEGRLTPSSSLPSIASTSSFASQSSHSEVPTAGSPKLATTTDLTGPASSTEGDSISYVARVRATGSSVFPTGTVTFKDGSTVLATINLKYDKATLTTSALAPGSHTITAVYNPTGDYAASSSKAVSTSVAVKTFGTTTTLKSSLGSIVEGDPVTLSATVRSVGDTQFPTGTVTFKDGATVLGTVALKYDKASLTTTSLKAGSHSITAVYNGTTKYLTSGSTPVAVNVAAPKVATATTLAGPASATLGQAVSYTATVTPASGTANANGTVTFKDGTQVLGTVAVTSNKATFTTSSLALGSHSLTATYNPAGNFTSSSSAATPVTIVAAKVATATTLAGPASATLGQAVSYTATVTPASGTANPNGTVTFKDGTKVLGTVAVTSNKATFTTSSLALGSHSLTATYNPAGNFTSSSSAPLAMSVAPAQANSTTTLTASRTTGTVGDAVTFTSQVTSGGNATPTGTVTFKDGDVIIGTVALADGSASLTVRNLKAGPHSITASYSGDAATLGSMSSTVIVTMSNPVSQVQTMAEVTISPTQAVILSQINIAVYVHTLNGDPVTSGKVTFRKGSLVLGTGNLDSRGRASFTFAASLLGRGTFLVSAFYEGTDQYKPDGGSDLVFIR